jgi:predicted small integral membrane protein
MAFMLVLFTVASYAVPANKPSSGWPLMVVFDLILVVVCLVNNWIAERNLKAQPPQAGLLRQALSRGCESERA